MSHHPRRIGRPWRLLLAIPLLLSPRLALTCSAEVEPVRSFAIPAGSAELTLEEFAEQSGSLMLYLVADVRGVQTNPVNQSLTPHHALHLMLANTALKHRQVQSTGTFVIESTIPAREGLQSDPLFPSQPDPRPMKNPLFRAALAGLLGLSAPYALSQQPKEEVLELSPFTVVAKNDSAWIATNTLAGSRLNTELKDTPAVLDVLTRDMLEELGIDDLASALSLSANFEVNNGDLGDSAFVVNSSFTGPGKSLSFNTRGQGGSLARNYISTSFRPDFYTIDRIDNSSGPNAILFGIGSAGGVANVSTKRALLSGNARSLQFRFDEHGSAQAHFDGNWVLVEGKLAARLNVIRDNKEGYREWSDNDMDGLHLTLKARPFSRTEINFEYEKAERNDYVVDRRPIRQRLDTWLNAGSKVLTAPLSGNPAASPADGVGVFGAGQRSVWVTQGGFIVNQARTYQPVPGTTGGNPVFNEDLVPFEVNISGPGGRRNVDREIAALSIDQRLAEKLFLNFSLSREKGDARSHQTFQNGDGTDHTFLTADPNATIYNTAPATGFYDPAGILSPRNAQGQVLNPYAGQQYVEGRWRRRRDDNDQTFAQLTLAWTLEAGRLGRHNLVAVLGRSEADESGEEIEHVWEGAPFSPDVTGNASNRVVLRNYVTPGDWSTYHVGDWQNVEGLVWNHPTLGPRRAVWEPSSMRNDTTIRENGLIAVQSYFFSDRLVTTLGYRKDEQKVSSRVPYRVKEGAYVNSNGTLRIDGNSAIDKQTGAGNTKSLGLVYHFTDNVSAYYNTSNSFGPGNANLTGFLSTWLTSRGLVLDRPNETGEGQDYGLKFRFADGKYNLDIGAYETNTVNTSSTLGINSRGAGSVADYWNTIFRTLNAPMNGPQLFNITDEAAISALAGKYPNLRPDYVHARDLLDRASSGYEVRFSANPTPNLRLRLTYSYLESEKENILPRTLSELEQLNVFLTDLGSANPGVNISNLVTATPGALTIGQNLEAMNLLIDDIIDSNIGSFGISPHRINFHAGYDFQGRLRGLNVSGGVNWKAGSRVGEYLVVDPAQPKVVISRIDKTSDEIMDFSLSVRYRTKLKAFGDKTTATFQISASNLFRSGPEIDHRRYATTTVAPGQELPLRGAPTSTFLLDPRTISASVKFDF